METDQQELNLRLNLNAIRQTQFQIKKKKIWTKYLTCMLNYYIKIPHNFKYKHNKSNQHNQP